MVEIEAGETAAPNVAVVAAVSRAAEELKRRFVSGGTMFGSVAGRERRSLWAIVSFLFALAFAVSFVVVEAQIGGFWSMLRLGSASGLIVSLLLLGLTVVSSRSLPPAPEDDERQQGDEGAEMKAEGQPPAEEPHTEERAPTSEEDFQASQSYFDAYFDGAVDPIKPLEADAGYQESSWQRLEEFKARAKDAELRVKKREAELHTAPSAPESKQ